MQSIVGYVLLNLHKEVGRLGGSLHMEKMLMYSSPFQLWFTIFLKRELFISCWAAIKINLQVVDPPNLKVLEIGRCPNLRDICCESCLTYVRRSRKWIAPNLRELTLGDDICSFFIFEPHKHSNYSLQLRLDYSLVRSL